MFRLSSCSPSLSDWSCIHALCMFALSLFLLSVCTSMCFSPPCYSHLDCPVNWGSSGLLLFSCFLRYLFPCLCPLTFKLSPLCVHFIVSEPKLSNSWFLNTQAYIFFVILHIYTQNHTWAHLLVCTHPCFRENIITRYMHLSTPTVDPCARSTIREKLRSQLGVSCCVIGWDISFTVSKWKTDLEERAWKRGILVPSISALVKALWQVGANEQSHHSSSLNPDEHLDNSTHMQATTLINTKTHTHIHLVTARHTQKPYSGMRHSSTEA